jgi:hypothetical protein
MRWLVDDVKVWGVRLPDCVRPLTVDATLAVDLSFDLGQSRLPPA